ncbi:KIF-binding protein [Condylostylus longicornis]|uniref:KIF-binding protein n=1 Tax=Condylostylus longicornis TaxID=2530218 RepID=UPI00244DEF2D|nr:KIF-binding protein [Condylostylus longicornis]
MVIPKETLTDLKEQYEKAYKLVDEESENDPPTDPYKSHYAAKEILKEMMNNLKNFMHSDGDESEQFIFKAILAFIYRDIGRICVFCEEVPAGENYLQQSLELIGENYLKNEMIISYIGASNELGIVWANRNETQRSEQFFTQSENAYNDFKKLDIPPMAISDIFGTVDEIETGKGIKELEKLFTLTTFYKAQMLGKLGNLELSAKYCNLTLRRQIMNKEGLDYIDWALNSATLSQYYIGVNKFTEARHHLAAASFILSEYEEKMISPGMSEDAISSVKENFNHRYADVARCWSKYGLTLLNASKDRLMADTEDKLNKDLENLMNCGDYKFENLNLWSIENGITDKYCLTFDDAKVVFHFVTLWLDRSKEYYKSDTEASEYARIIIDFSELYKVMAFFDDIPSNQSKMHKKRADYLEDLLKILNPKYYLVLCRECWYNAGLAYCAMLDVKLDAISNLKYDEKPTPHALHKINMLCDKAINHFKQFIDSYIDKDTETLKDGILSSEKELYLFAHFHLGRLFYKIITPNKENQLNNLSNSLKFYKLFVEGCEADKEASKALQAEIGVCKEMVILLPHKISKTIDEMKQISEL